MAGVAMGRQHEGLEEISGSPFGGSISSLKILVGLQRGEFGVRMVSDGRDGTPKGAALFKDELHGEVQI